MSRADGWFAPAAAFLLIIVAMIVFPSIASAHAGNSDPAVIHACVQQSSNQVRIVGVNGACTNAEVPAHWAVAGPKGATGDTGATGAAGPAGATGPAGVAGPAGATGPTGNTGATGAAGVQGVAGPTGADGATGAAGPQGIAGPIGATGAAGPQGNAGPIGATGAVGPQGIAGPIGATGAVGPQGIAGPIGATGATGRDGVNGQNGAPGTDGAPGSQGVQGDPGPQGAPGPSSGALVYAEQVGIGQPGAAYGDGASGIYIARDLPAGTLVIQASGTAWCGGYEYKDIWVTVQVDGVGIGTLSGGTIMCDGARRTLTSAYVVLTIPAGPHTIEFPTGGGANYDSADRWNVTLLEFSNAFTGR